MSQSIEKVEKKRLFEVRTNNNKQRYQFCGLSFCIFLHDFASSSTLEIKSRSTLICAYSNYANLSYGSLCTMEKLWNGLWDVIPTVIT